LEFLRHARGVLEAEAAEDGARIRVESRAVIPALVVLLAAHEVPVYGITARPPTLEDVYFAITAGQGAR
jgi:hypothetical protein